MDELDEIERLAREQMRGGRFTSQSNSLFALELIARLADAIKRLREESGTRA